MTNKTMIAKAVKAALYGGLATSLAISAPVTFAAEEEEAETVVVTGSRLKRTDIETAQPVTVITREDIDLSGDATVADVLQTSVFNSFGSFRETSGFSNGQASVNEVSLRGLGSNRTLVLLDGRRIASSGGSGAASQNLNQIPLDVVERIDILRDGASAIYGSDAIAGVINIITRKDYDGLNFTIQHEEPNAGAEGTRFSITSGASSDRGTIMFNFASYDRRPQFYRDLPYAANAPDSFGISSFGFPGGFIDVTTSIRYADPRCPANVGDSSQFPNSYTWDVATGTVGVAAGPGTLCGYNFAADIKSVPDVRRNSMFVNGTYALTDNIQFNSRFLYSLNRGESRFAGTPVTGPFPIMDAANPNNPLSLYGVAAAPVVVLARTVPNGTRDNKVDENVVDVSIGLEGTSDAGFDWGFNIKHNQNVITNTTYNLVSKSRLQNLLDNGLDFFEVNGPLDQDLMRTANHTGLYEAELTTRTIDGFVGFDIAELDAGAISAVVGFEHYDLDFMQLNDPESNLLDVAGSAGGDNIVADRQVSAVYFEAGIPLSDMVDINLAGRYDDYSDFGGNFSPQIGVSVRPTDNILVRASYGEGFRAPSMSQLYGNQSESFPSGTDLVGCANEVALCTPTQYRALIGGNPNLEAEDSTSYTAGFVWQITDGLDLELTAYHTEFTNLITTSSLNREFQAEFDGQPNSVVRNPTTGQVDFVALTQNNFEGVETEGLDFGINYRFELGSGDMQLGLEASKVTDYTVQTFAESTPDNQAGDLSAPDFRANINASYSVGDVVIAGQISHIAGQEQTFGTTTFTVGSHQELDLQFAWNTSWNGKVSVGARNITDEDPELNADFYGWQPFDFGLYNTLGRTWYVRYEQDF